MPFDETKCTEYIIKLDKQANELHEKIMQITSIRNNLMSIKSVKQKTNHADESVIVDMVIPIDIRTGKPFTTQHRDEVYETNIKLADQL